MEGFSSMKNYEDVLERLASSKHNWLVTGVAGFIGSNILEELLSLGQNVIGLDDLSTGREENLIEVKKIVGITKWKNFKFIQASINSYDDCLEATKDIDFVLHQAALGSVPRSLAYPQDTHRVNVDGFVNILRSCNVNKVKRLIFASSSSVYGDIEESPKLEENIGNVLSPYALSKRVNEEYADVFHRCFNLEYLGLRYFNVFGPRQDPSGPYAAVIPLWIKSMLRNEQIIINGDGKVSRDFCYVKNVVQANILSSLNDNRKSINQIYNIACQQTCDLNELIIKIQMSLSSRGIKTRSKILNGPKRKGDIMHSLASIKKAKDLLSYKPNYNLDEGIEDSIDWYIGEYRS